MVTYARLDKGSIKVFEIHLHVTTAFNKETTKLITSAIEQAVHVIHFFFPEFLLLLWRPSCKIVQLGHKLPTQTVFPRKIAQDDYYFFCTKRGRLLILREGSYLREAII